MAAKAKRAQIAATPIYTSIEEVDDALRQLCDIESRCKSRTAKLELRITELREKANDDMAKDLADKARLERDIEDYCTYYREDIFPKNSKSIVLTHGEVNYRSHPASVKVKSKTDTVIANIESTFGEESTYIRIKKELNKDALITLPEADLTKLGLKLEKKESFGYNLKLESIAEAAGARVLTV